MVFYNKGYSVVCPVTVTFCDQDSGSVHFLQGTLLVWNILGIIDILYPSPTVTLQANMMSDIR